VLISRNEVEEAYRVLLGRQPENDHVIALHSSVNDHLEMICNIARSEESLARTGLSAVKPSPFFHVNTSIDVASMVSANVDHSRQPLQDYFVNFLGVAVPTDVFEFLHDKGGQLDVVPLPANWHADMAEWSAAIRAIDLAGSLGNHFTMIELGSGWGCWMANTGVTAKRRGLKIEVLGVEGNPRHIDMCVRTMLANNIEKHEYNVVRGVAAAGSGYALFPKAMREEDRWGAEPIFGVSEEDARRAEESGEYEQLEMKPLSEVINDRPRIDLLHIDIQGGEGDLIHDTMDILDEKVAYLLIGTHSRMLEGRIMDMLLVRGWALEVERPAIFNLVNGTPQTTVDGVQGWRNRKFHP
jgi:FkbM family methyltransferase